MTSSEFEAIAKDKALSVLRENYDDARMITVDMMHLVWFAHVLGNKKCLIWPEHTAAYVEVTFNALTESLYVDVYAKQSHTINP